MESKLEHMYGMVNIGYIKIKTKKKIGGGERDAGVRNPTPPQNKPKKIKIWKHKKQTKNKLM